MKESLLDIVKRRTEAANVFARASISKGRGPFGFSSPYREYSPDDPQSEPVGLSAHLQTGAK